ncbi:hypothetical protein ARMA_0275 [Ardenticatena maritima]|uniref:Uncharacterized protein n=1 Tax=Ardenticatena maritima TaxID=872965 RepID=A0A0M8K6Q2_9CHLR|nr:hypothetical protein ARMA_0275 [Ardenticatena maritima]
MTGACAVAILLFTDAIAQDRTGRDKEENSPSCEHQHEKQQ